MINLAFLQQAISIISSLPRKTIHHGTVGTTPNGKDFHGISDDGLLNAGNKFKTFLRKSKQ